MPAYKYTAYNRQNTLVQDEIEAPDERAARAQIKDLGYFPVELQAISKRMKVSVSEVIEEAKAFRNQVQDVFSDQSERLIVFAYTATSGDSSEIISGKVEAHDAREARSLLRARNLFPLEVKTTGQAVDTAGLTPTERFFSRLNLLFERLFPPKVPMAELTLMAQQMAAMVEASIPVIQSLELVEGNIANKKLKSVLDEMKSKIEMGASLSMALNDYKEIFPSIFRELVQAGESGGNLDENLRRVSNYLEDQMELQAKIKGAMTYPIVVLGLITLIVTGLLVFVVPTFISLFKDFKIVLPLPTRILIFTSDFIMTKWYLIFVGAFAAVIFWGIVKRTQAGRDMIERISYKIPLVGSVVYKSMLTRIVFTLALSFRAGLSVTETLDSTSKTITYKKIAGKLDKVRQGVLVGQSLGQLFKETEMFPSVVVQMVKIGEETGRIDDMMARAATYLKHEVDQAIKRLTSAMEPIMTVVLGGIVFFVMGSLYLPVISLLQQGIK